MVDSLIQSIFQKTTHPILKIIEEIKTKTIKSFAKTVDSVCNVPLSQIPISCMKGDILEISITKDEFELGLEACKHNLYGRII